MQNPPYFDGMTMTPEPVTDVIEARVLAVFGDSSPPTTSPRPDRSRRPRPPAHYLMEHGVEPADFNSYGARRGNHNVMMRGTFANIRIRNKITPDIEGGVTKHLPSGEVMAIYDAAMRYQSEGRPLVVFAGKEYGTGSSRDWAAKGTKLLGVRAVIAESFERIHRSNLVGMGVLPLQFKDEGWQKLGLTGDEIVSIRGLEDLSPRSHRDGGAYRPSDGRIARFPVVAASIRRPSSNITATAASCPSSCATWRASPRRRSRSRRAIGRNASAHQKVRRADASNSAKCDLMLHPGATLRSTR